MPSRAKPSAPPKDEAPRAFRVARETPVGRHPLLAVFPGLDRLPLAEKLEPDPTRRVRLFDETCVEIVDEDMWMYVAPKELPKSFRRQWKPVVSPSDCIVVGRSHLAESPALMLFLDIYHELRHLVQRREGADLWPPGVRYVDRTTEIDAYRLVVDEARRLGISVGFLKEYLKVDWISDDEHRELVLKMDLPAD